MRLKDYIQSNKRGKEANRLEREALNDPFMQDALEGFDAITGDHVAIIEELEKKYTIETRRTPSLRRTRMLYWSIAASILLLIGFGSYFFLGRNKNDVPVIAKVLPIENESIVLVDSSELLPKPIEELQQEKLAIAKTIDRTTKKSASVPAPAPAPTPSPIALDTDKDVNDHLSENNLAVTEQGYLSEQQETPAMVESAANLKFRSNEERTFRGKVVDETGEPLVGVSIIEKGTNIGTVTDVDGTFALQLSKGDSSKLIANYIGYMPQEIKPLDTNQTVILSPDNHLLSEVVVVGYGIQKKSAITGAVSKIVEGKAARMKINENDSDQSTFGEKEFQTFCQQKADKNVCEGQNAIVKVSFFIDETGKPSQVKFKSFSCEEAKEEIENLLASSPTWTKTNRKVTMTIKW